VILGRQAGVEQVAVDISPVLNATVIEESQIFSDNPSTRQNSNTTRNQEFTLHVLAHNVKYKYLMLRNNLNITAL